MSKKKGTYSNKDNKQIIKVKPNSKEKKEQNYRFKNIHLVFALLIYTFFIYLKVFQNDLTNRDDGKYITENPYLLTLGFDNIVAIFSNFYMGNYHPLSMLCLSLGYQIGGTNPWIYQLINLCLHLINTYLVYTLIKALLEYKNLSEKHVFIISIITSGFFALHTIHVESVAWISENKTVLYAMFFLLSLKYYIQYLKSKSGRFYILSLVLFLCSLLSKGMAVSLTLTIIIIDLFLERKILSKKVIVEKIPFLILSILFGVIAIIAQGTAASTTNGGGEFSILRAMSFASYGLIQYVLKLIAPFNLSALYEYLFIVNGPLPVKYYYYLGIAVILAISLALLIKKKSLYFFGITFFFVNIVMVLQLLPVGDAIMSDRYAYIPSIGFFFILGAMVTWLIDRKPSFRYPIILFLLGYGFYLSVLTYNRIGVWKDSLTLWTDILEKSDFSKYSKAWLTRGSLLNVSGRYQEAFEDIKIHFKAHGVTADAYFQRAYSKSFLNDPWGAIEDYGLAAELDSIDPKIFNNRANIKTKMNYCFDALADYNRAIALSDTFVDAYNGRADAKIIMRDYNGALDDLNYSIKLRNTNPVAFNNRGIMKKNLGDISGALNDFNIAIKLNPDFLEAYQNRIDVNMKLGNYPSAIMDLDYIISNQQIPIAYYFRGVSKYKMGLKHDACSDFQQALKMGYGQIEDKFLSECN